MHKTLKLITLILLLAFAATEANAQEKLIGNVGSREKITLDGYWKVIVDPYETGFLNYRGEQNSLRGSYFTERDFNADRTQLVEYDFNMADSLLVPGDWNTQKTELMYYEGTVWYRKKVFIPKGDKRTFLYFGAVNYDATVAFNGQLVGKHTGGFTPFNFEVTDLVKEDAYNSIIVKVDNRRREDGVPTVNCDWWNFGGITRSAYLIRTPRTFIRDYSIGLKKGSTDDIEGWVQLDGTNKRQTVSIYFPGKNFEKRLHTDKDGYAYFSMDDVKGFTLWEPENPILHQFTISIKGEELQDKVGLRSISTQGTKILLNGKEIFLKGICIHEEQAFEPSGRATGRQDDKVLLDWAKELGCNFVRLAHYPHNEDMIRLADEMGIMVWSEIPVYWTIQFNNPDTYNLAEQQLCEMISRDKNRASVIIWSVANETPRSAERLEFLNGLIKKTKELDATRLVTAAMETEYTSEITATVKDNLQRFTDIISFNTYVGWYDGVSDKCDDVNWQFSEDKPVVISEMGGGALYGMRGDASMRFTEEYQEYLYIKNIEMMERIPGLAGVSPWILKDFRSPKRMLGGVQNGFNRKGLISENGDKKLAFFILQDWYSKK